MVVFHLACRRDLGATPYARTAATVRVESRFACRSVSTTAEQRCGKSSGLKHLIAAAHDQHFGRNPC